MGSDRILRQSPARDLCIMGSALPAVTIFTCLGIALSLGHVKIWPLPMISDCGWDTPEKWVFRLGLITGAGLLARMADLVRDFILHVSGDEEDSLLDWAVRVSYVASLGLAGCAAVSEKECNPLHSTLAVIFFVGFCFFQCIVSWRIASLGVPPEFHAGAWTFKQALTILCVVDLIAYIIVAATGQPMWCQAICEWSGTMMVRLLPTIRPHNMSRSWATT